MQQILLSICREEGVTPTREVLRHLEKEAAGDVRSAINDLQTVCQGKLEVGTEDLKVLGYRNREIKIFDGLRHIFRARNMQTAAQIAWSIDESPDSLILWLDENIPLEYKKPIDLASAYHFLSAADVFLGRTRRRQRYTLWRYASDLMFGGVAIAKSHPYPGSRRYRFPAYLRKMSTSKSTRISRRNLTAKIGRYAHMSGRKTADMLPIFRLLWGKNLSFARDLAHRLDLTEDELSIVLDAQQVKQVFSPATGPAVPPATSAQQSIYDYD
jgi:replication factor C large subunit